jgi:membrane protein implicated in regulation of membrane protease activity
MRIYGQYARALGLFLEGALALFFLVCPGAALAASGELDAMLSGYVVRMILALIILGLLGYAAARFLPGRFSPSSRGHLKILGAVSLGRDMLYVVRTGPDVVAFFSGRGGAEVLGRWSAEEWDDYAAGAEALKSFPADEKRQ